MNKTLVAIALLAATPAWAFDTYVEGSPYEEPGYYEAPDGYGYGYAYAEPDYSYGYAPRAYGYGYVPRVYNYGYAPRVYGYAYAPRVYGYGYGYGPYGYHHSAGVPGPVPQGCTMRDHSDGRC